MPERARQRLAERCIAAVEALPNGGSVALGGIMRALTGTEARDYGTGEFSVDSIRRGLLALALRASGTAPLPPRAGDRSEDDIAAACGVTTRTIRRWRQSWLSAVWRSAMPGVDGPVIVIPAPGWAAICARGLNRRPERERRIGAREREAIRVNAADLQAGGVGARRVVKSLARLHSRSDDAIRRALGRTPVHRAAPRTAMQAWRLWLRGVSQQAIAERLNLSTPRVHAIILGARAEWVLESTSSLRSGQATHDEQACHSLRTQEGIGRGLPRHPWAAPLSGARDRSAVRVPDRMRVARSLLATARALAGGRPQAARIDRAETLLRWVTLLLRAEGEPIAQALLRRARRELGVPPESLAPAMRERLYGALGMLLSDALMQEVWTPTSLGAERRAALAFARVISRMAARTQGAARLVAPSAPPDIFRDRFPWDLRLDTRALRALERGSLASVTVARRPAADIVVMRLGLQGEAPLAATEVPWAHARAEGSSLRDWERLSVLRR